MAVDFNDKRFRSDFKAERDRILAAIRDCESLDKDLNDTVTSLKAGMQRNRGAASLVVRMTEQIISNRNLRLSLIKELRALKRDVIEREIKLAEKEGEQNATAGAAGVTAALLAHLQSVILTPGSNTSTLEPPPVIAETTAGAVEPQKTEEEIAEELELPDEIRPGDIVSDPEGNLWVIGDDGAEETGLMAAECYPEPEEGVPYAILQDGRTVLVVDIG